MTLVQWMVHYANDHFDQAADAANRHRTRWSGGSGVLQENLLPQRAGLAAALALGAASLVPAAVLLGPLAAGAAAGALMLAILVLAWSYSGPPLRLHARGLGAPTVAVVVTILVPLVAYRLQGGGWGEPALLILAPLALLQAAALLGLDLPDRHADAAAGKRTLAVRWGLRRAVAAQVALLATGYAALPLAWWAGAPAAPLAALGLTAPLALWLAWRLARGAPWPAERLGSVAAGGILLLGAATGTSLAALFL